MVALLSPNPWGELPERPPYVLPRDRAALDEWNARASGPQKVRTELVPDPQLGNPLEAAVIVLALNPSFDDPTLAEHHDPEMVDQMRTALTDVRDFFWLRDGLEETTGGRWWRAKLNPLIAATSLEAVRAHVAGAHLHQYHSKSSSPGFRPPSRRHHLELVRKALPRDVPLLALTGVAQWRLADPDFRDAPLHEPQSPQSMVVSANNMPSGFDAAVAAITRAAGD